MVLMPRPPTVHVLVFNFELCHSKLQVTYAVVARGWFQKTLLYPKRTVEWCLLARDRRLQQEDLSLAANAPPISGLACTPFDLQILRRSRFIN
jgi:hypothetical protein